MKQITLRQETLSEIKDYMDSYALTDEESASESAEFEQDNVTIFVDFQFYGHVEEDVLVHTELPYNNVENLSYIATDDAKVVNVEACDENGETVGISNEDTIYNL